MRKFRKSQIRLLKFVNSGATPIYSALWCAVLAMRKSALASASCGNPCSLPAVDRDGSDDKIKKTKTCTISVSSAFLPLLPGASAPKRNTLCCRFGMEAEWEFWVISAIS